MYADAFTFTRYYPAIACVKNLVRGVDPSQGGLVSACSTSKNWCRHATALLYTTPFLTSHRAVESFAETMAGSPELAALVREVYVIEQGENLFFLRGLTTDQLRPFQYKMHTLGILVQSSSRHFDCALP